MSARMNESNKKAQAIWISWVLLILMVIIVGTVAGKYIIDKAGQDAQSLKKYALNKEECDNVDMRVDFICKNSKTLNMTILNNGNIKIDRVLTRLYDTAGNSENREIEIGLKPGQTKDLQLPRGRSAYELEITPLIEVEDLWVECREKTTTETNIQDC
jgi:hypothetical protein